MKTMKKLLALILSLCMILSVSASFAEVVGTGDVHFADPDTSMLDQEILGSLPHYKIAFSYYSFTDKLGSQFKLALEYVAKAFNVELVSFESGQGDEAVTNIESVLAAGDIDGVIYVGGSQALLDVCQKYKVPFISACGFPSTETEQQGCASYDVYLGGVIDDDVWAGTKCIEALYNAGCRNLCFSGLTLGFVKSHDDREQAMQDFIKEHPDMKLLSESLTIGDWASDISTFAASFGGIMDSYICTGCNDAIYSGLDAEGLTDGSVKFATVDISSQTGVYYKNGVQVWTCGGQYVTPVVAFAILYNYIHDGVRMIPDATKPLIRKYIEITSYEDYENYCKFIEADIPPYTAEEVSRMMLVFNPDVTLETLQNDADTYGLADVMARHADLIK